MLTKAQQTGLKVTPFNAAEDAWKMAPKDSFADFLNGLYAKYARLRYKGDGRLYRQYAQGMQGLPAVNISVDESVWKRWADTACKYPPRTLADAHLSPPEE
ncbi:hypothetical protein [Halomonas halocynthiae]|uniref:hypothetical protein n=1 Tax=Halomonas halocynthiae TaxID=176290 RepID=UPI00041755B9|nr:hypothetical protein [Halomonas halocynthiae]